jgi:hypothetical protein
VSTEERLAQLLSILEEAGLACLVMGGHADRFYGVGRNTVHFDIYASAASMQDVRDALARAEASGNLTAREGPSWRPADFARFEIGQLDDGREEWLEFWLRNHLLPNFAERWFRRECGAYGGRQIAFLSLPDLIRSKETEREGDWADLSLLEEILDARHLAQAAISGDPSTLLSSIASRRGYERALNLGLLADQEAVRSAAQRCEHPVSFAFLVPFARDSQLPAGLRFKIDEAFLAPLRTVEPEVSKHIALVEVVRRSYKRWAMELDRRDKMTHKN